MRNRVYSFVVLVLLLTLNSLAFAQSPQISTGLSWLYSAQTTTGNWPETATTDYYSTAAALDAIYSVDPSSPACGPAFQWLSSQIVSPTDYLSRQIVALKRAGQDASGYVASLLLYRNSDGGFSGADDCPNSYILDTALALQALSAISYSDTTLIGQSLNYLMAKQNTDGGWGLAVNDPSNAYVTAIVLITLSSYISQFNVQSSIDKAKSYLLTKQNTDGGFGSSPSTIYETALSIISLIESRQTSIQPLQNAVNYLAANQLSDGSWNNDAYSTALALQALAKVKPNLTITRNDIVLSNAMPTVGETITVTATVQNTGLDEADNVVVYFYDHDPARGGSLIASQTIASIPAGGSAQVTIPYSVLASGAGQIYVVVDPISQISELSQIDNSASNALWGATIPDLAVYPEDLKPSTYVPASETAFTLEYTVRNLGESSAGAFSVSLYDGNPVQGGTLLQTEDLSGIGGAEIRTGTIGVTLTGDGPHTLYLVADAGSAIQETSETNNTGTVTVNVGGTQTLADLSVNAADLVLVPSRPHANDTVLIAALVKNQGAEGADNFSVEFYDGAPDAGGVLINTQTVSLVAGGEKSLTAQWSIPEGIHDVYVVIDRMNAIIESDENNNRTSARVMTDMVDITLSTTDLVISPGHPVSGDAVALSITMRNTGIKGTGAFNLALYNNDPNAGGTLLQTYAVSSIQGDGSTTVTYAFSASPQIYRFYVVADPDNRVTEMYEGNNTAIRSLTIKSPGETLGPDLVPVKLDLADTTADPQTLAVTGTARVTLQNTGDDKVTTAFNVLVFEDKDNDGRYTSGVDTLLGTGTNSLALWPESANLVDVALSGTVQFLHAPLYALVDSGDAILEQNEDNNLLASCKDCQVVPTNPIQANVKWQWGLPSGVWLMNGLPTIMHLRDTNGDGKIDQNDVPDIALVSLYDGRTYGGKIWAFKGDTGENYFSLYDPNHTADALRPYLSSGDLDGDGKPEIVFASTSNGLLVYNNDWTLKWDNTAQLQAWKAAHPATAPGGWLYPTLYAQSNVTAVADMDGDGVAEIISGPTVVSADGSIRCAKNASTSGWTGNGIGGFGSNGAVYANFAAVADLNLDGQQEIVAGNAAYDKDCITLWWKSSLPDGATAIANFDDDPYPEIVLVGRLSGESVVYLLDHNGSVKWGPVSINQLQGLPPQSLVVSQPIVADFDGDGKSEIGIRSLSKLFVFNKDGQLKSTLTIPNKTGYAATAPTVFDLDGDRIPEVIINSGGYLRALNGKDGSTLFQDAFGGGENVSQNVQVADVDGDGQVELVVMGHDDLKTLEAIRVYHSADPDHPWTNGRRIWNETAYHVTNVNDDGSIPQHEAPSWMLNNSYITQAGVGPNPNPNLTPNLTASYLRAEQNGLSVDIAVRVGNGGAVASPASVLVTFYDGDPANGGVVTGTASTARALNPGQYQDVIYSWSGGSLGLHHIYAVVDAANAIAECRKDDNQAALDVTVENGYADVKIGPEDIMLPPAPYYEGDIIPVAVNVKNIGAIPASNVSVKLYNGIPSAGGAQVGMTRTLSSIDAGVSATVAFSFDTLGKAGANVLYIVLDQENSVIESNETNNIALVSIDIQTPLLPNLAITADNIQLSSASVPEGAAVTITATISNRGSATSNTPVRIYLGDPAAGGTVISEQTIYPVLMLGGTAAVSANLNTAGLAGPQTVFVTIDPLNTIAESSKADNTASRALFIQSSGLSSSLALDKTAYQPNETMTATITVTNSLAMSRNLNLNLAVTDSAGSLIATVAQTEPLTVNPNGTAALARTWNTGATLSGDYKLTTEIAERGTVISRANAEFTITADKSVNAAVVVDKVSYNPNETAALTSTITSKSANTFFENMTAVVTVGSQQSAVFTERKTITALMPGATYTFKSYWNTGTFASGTYPVLLEVRDAAGALIATGSRNLVIASTVKPSALLKGQVSADRQVILAGEAMGVSYSVTNVGNTDLPYVSLAIKTVSVDEQTVYDTITDQAGLTRGGSYTNAHQLDTAKYSAKDYLVVLRANIAGVEETIAGTYFRVEGSPTAPSLNSPATGSDVWTFTPVLTVNNASDPNDDKIAYEFELYADPGLTRLEASSGRLTAGAGVTAWPAPFMLTENRTYYWRARAFDGWLYGPWMAPASFRVNTANDPPTAPVPTSPVDGMTVDTFTPALMIDNAFDPDSEGLTYNFEVALDPDFTQVVESATGVFAGQGATSWQAPMNLMENVTYYWRAQADDWLATGPWSATARFFVNTVNSAPTTPVITAPANGSEVAALDAEITVQNSTDPDSSVLTYYFEADTVMTFDSSGAVRSEGVPQGQGTTTWRMAGLSDNTIYYLRAKASDGQAESPWSGTVSFFVNTANDPPSAPSPLNPSNGAGVNVFTPTLSAGNATDPDYDVLTYEFALYADADLTMLVASASNIEETPEVTSWTVPVALIENQNYYWRARAFDGALTGAWTPPASFMVNTANDAPGAPALSSPADGSSVATLYPALAIINAVDPDRDRLVYDFEVYKEGALVSRVSGAPEGGAGATSVTVAAPLADNTAYQWRARAFDGDRYGPWMTLAGFTVHVPRTGINATIDVDPDTLNKTSSGTWVVVYIELPAGHRPADIDISSIRLEDAVPAEAWPYAVGDHDKDGIVDLMVKFRRSDAINCIPAGEKVPVRVTGKVGATTFDGVDVIRVIP